MKIIFSLVTTSFKEKVFSFCKDDKGIFAILTAFSAFPLIMLTLGTIDFVQINALQNKIDNVAILAIRAGKQNFNDQPGQVDTNKILNFVKVNLSPYTFQKDANATGYYNINISTYTDKVIDETVIGNESYGVQNSLVIHISGGVERTHRFHPFKGNDSRIVPIESSFRGSTYLPPLEIAFVVDSTRFQVTGRPELFQAGSYVDDALNLPIFVDWMTPLAGGSSPSQRSIRTAFIPYSSTVKLNYNLLKPEMIRHLDRYGNTTSFSNTTGFCVTETWNGNEVSSLPYGLQTYQNYYYSNCSSGNITICAPEDWSFQKSGFAGEYRGAVHVSRDIDSKWLNFNCPALSIMGLSNYPVMGVTEDFSSMLTRVTSGLNFFMFDTEGRVSKAKPLPHLGLLWAARFLNNPNIWLTTRFNSSTDPRTKKIIILISGDAPLRQVPLAWFWDVKEYQYTYVIPTSSVIGRGELGYIGLINPTHTSTNIDYYGALGYTHEIDRNYMRLIDPYLTIGYSTPYFQSGIYNMTKEQATVMTEAVLDSTENICQRIKAIPNLKLYSIYYDVDPNAFTEGVENPAVLRSQYHSILKNACTSNPTWSENNAKLTYTGRPDDYSIQIANSVKAAIIDSKYLESLSNYQIVKLN